MPKDAGRESQDIVLKNGLIVDGTGGRPYTANLLIRAGRVHRIVPRPIRTDGVSIDCSGKVVAPGFIDCHSHLDWQLPLKGHEELKYPFLAQGITTVIGGNCGSSAAGFREASTWISHVADVPMNTGRLTPQWETVAELFERLASAGASHNLALLAGHGSARSSIRGLNPSPLHPYEMKEMLRLLEVALDHGARGVSIGLQYQPGLFARPEELKEVAHLVKKRGAILAVHPRALSAVMPGAVGRGEARNVAALRELLDLARGTGVRLQVSHLAFAGARTWRTAEAALRLIDEATAEGVDVRFDVCATHATVVPVGAALSAWFLAKGLDAFEDGGSMRALRKEMRRVERLVGMGAGDVRVANVMDPDMTEYNGKALAEIARLRRASSVDALIDIARRSGGRARVLFERMGNDRVLGELVRHRASLFMTDASIERSGVQNPAAYGAVPRLLRLAREAKLLPLEDVVRRLTGAAAERFSIHDRGLLKEGLAADITVFDWENVSEGGLREDGSLAPEGIDYVFVNGRKIIGSGKKESPLNAGIPLPHKGP